MKKLLRKISILYFFKSIFIPVDKKENKILKSNILKYLVFCLKNKKDKTIISSFPSSGWNYFNRVPQRKLIFILIYVFLKYHFLLSGILIKTKKF